MARYKPENGKIMDITEADAALKELGLIEIELDRIDSQSHKEITAIKESAKKKGEALRSQMQLILGALTAFSEYNKNDLYPKDRKSLELTFGTLGYRKSTSISVKKTTLELLKKLKLDRFIRVSETPDKEAMRELDDEALLQVDAVRKVTDDFFAEPNRDRVNATLIGKSA